MLQRHLPTRTQTLVGLAAIACAAMALAGLRWLMRRRARARMLADPHGAADDARAAVTANDEHVDRMLAAGGFGLPMPNMADIGLSDPQVEIAVDRTPDQRRRMMRWIKDDDQHTPFFMRTTL